MSSVFRDMLCIAKRSTSAEKMSLRLISLGEIRILRCRAGLATRYNSVHMADSDIYPQIWERDGDDGRVYFPDYCDELEPFHIEAAEDRDAVIIRIG